MGNVFGINFCWGLGDTPWCTFRTIAKNPAEMRTILTGDALWCLDVEILDRDRANDFAFHISGVLPFHRHRGEISLNERSLTIVGGDILEILLEDLTELYLGFDEIYTRSLSKNFGMFWEPLRITMNKEQSIYLVIDYSLMGGNSKIWFNQLKQMLA